MEIDLTIDDKKLCEWLLNGSKKAAIPVDELIIKILNDYLVKNPIKKSPLDNVQKLINFYLTQYAERFLIDSDEKIDNSLVKKIWNSTLKANGDENTTLEILQKAIIWYLYVHNSKDADGKSFPYQLRIFCEQSWLRRLCIESSINLDINIIKNVIAQHKDPKDIARALKRGDYSGGFDNDNLTQEWESVLQLATRLFMEKKIPASLRRAVEIKDIFRTEIPSKSYLIKARKFLEEYDD